ncbi:MAG TPA: hypothetical protein VH144_02695 [Candidatus Saccharimonadales bacterium]|jgi:hypothetical protein|nr:hypothetical protein [Candidatus Saccharimonadales bacterium]
MNVQPLDDQHPATDDQELAKVLAGVDDQVSQLPTEDAAAAAASNSGSGLQFEETPLASEPAAPAADPVAAVAPDAAATTVEAPAAPPEPAVAPVAAPAATASPELESIKKDALEELRPLVTKLDLPADEKFDTMLLIIRSTDDQSLLGPAHEAAKAISDEKKRAEALLDIIKEIDYFGNKVA